MKTGAAYIRVSTNDQAELSPDAQRRLILEYAEKHGIFISSSSIFVENGISGKQAKNRPAFQQMIGLAKSSLHPYNVILVWKYSRFARNQEESIVYKSMLKKDNVDVISVSEPLIDGPFGSLIERIIEWMDEYYSIRLSGEVIRGMTENAMRGGYQSAPCLGYCAVGKGKPHQIIEEEIQIVQIIFDYFTKNLFDTTQIARKLNEYGFHTKRGNLFERRTVEYILKNPFYIGRVSWQAIQFEGLHEVRISPEQFEQAARRFQSEYTKRLHKNPSVYKHFLSGLLLCPICHSSLCYSHSSRGSNKAGSFQCWKYGKGIHNGSAYVSESGALFALCQSLEQLTFPVYSTFQFHHTKYSEDLFRPLHLRLSQLKSREKKLRTAYENGVDSLEEYQTRKAAIQKESEQIHTQIHELSKTLSYTEAQAIKACTFSFEEFIMNPVLSSEQASACLRSVLKKIEYTKSTKEFHFYYYL